MEEDRVTFWTEPPKTDLQQPEEVGGDDDKMDEDPVDVGAAATTSGKRKRDSRKPTLASLGLSGELAVTAGGKLAPYEVTVNAGENVVDHVLAFSQRCRKAVCILSANGAVSSVLISRPGSFATSDASKFEGYFPIVSLSGSYLFFGRDDGERRRKKGKLTVSLAEPNGRVFGGEVEGSLIAAGPIKLVMASFKQDIYKQKTTRRKSAGSSAAAAPSNSNSDTETDPLEEEAPSMMEAQPSNCPSPTSGLLPTTTGVSENVNFPANQNMSSASVNTSVGQTLRPITAQGIYQDGGPI